MSTQEELNTLIEEQIAKISSLILEAQKERAVLVGALQKIARGDSGPQSARWTAQQALKDVKETWRHS